MNLKLKLAIKNYIDNGVDMDISLTVGVAKMIIDITNSKLSTLVLENKENLKNGDVDILRYCNLEVKKKVTGEDENILSYVPELHTSRNNNSLVEQGFIDAWCDKGNKTPRVVVTHANCNDGKGVALVLKYLNDDILHLEEFDISVETIYLDYKAYNFDELLEKLEGKLVFVSDFSFPYDEHIRISDCVNHFFTLDHHKGALESKIADLPDTYIDTSASGALLTWDMFTSSGFLPNQVPFIIELISDRDLWNFFHGDYSKAFSKMINDYTLTDLVKFINDEVKLKSILEEKYIPQIVAADKRNIETAKEAVAYDIAGIRCHGLNLTSSRSEVLNHVSRLFGTPSFSFAINNQLEVMEISFRNYTDDIDVADLAKIFKGSGHQMSAGAKIPLDKVNFKEFIINKQLKGESND